MSTFYLKPKNPNIRKEKILAHAGLWNAYFTSTENFKQIFDSNLVSDQIKPQKNFKLGLDFSKNSINETHNTFKLKKYQSIERIEQRIKQIYTNQYMNNYMNKYMNKNNIENCFII